MTKVLVSIKHRIIYHCPNLACLDGCKLPKTRKCPSLVLGYLYNRFITVIRRDGYPSLEVDWSVFHHPDQQEIIALGQGERGQFSAVLLMTPAWHRTWHNEIAKMLVDGPKNVSCFSGQFWCAKMQNMPVGLQSFTNVGHQAQNCEC